MNLSSSEYASRCDVEVSAGRPHPLCDIRKVVAQVPVPLVQADITGCYTFYVLLVSLCATALNEKEKHLLRYVYGDLPDEMLLTMRVIIVTGLVLLVLAVVGHLLLVSSERTTHMQQSVTYIFSS